MGGPIEAIALDRQQCIADDDKGIQAALDNGLVAHHEIIALDRGQRHPEGSRLWARDMPTPGVAA